MKNFIFFILSAVLSLTLILPGTTTVMADPGQKNKNKDKQEPVVRAALMIRNPDTAEVGQPVTITVFSKYDNQPVAEAEVYALKTDKIVSTADNKHYNTNNADYESFVRGTGVSLGQTGSDGSIICEFSDSSRYLLVALKVGYIPGTSRINITLAAQKGLYLRAPGSAQVGTSFNVTVVERFSKEPVASAAVYALGIGEISLPQPTVHPVSTNIKEAGKIVKVEAITTAQEVQNAEEFQQNGFLLGYTFDNGMLACTVNETGHYALAAIKENYAPGFARMAITPVVSTTANTTALIMKLPAVASIDETVSILVRERQSGAAVAQANIYSLRIEDNEEGNGLLFRADPPSNNTTAKEKFADLVTSKGSCLGSTDDNGIFPHAFSQEGHYILVAVKDGYAPDFARIHIKNKTGISQNSTSTLPSNPNRKTFRERFRDMFRHFFQGGGKKQGAGG